MIVHGAACHMARRGAAMPWRWADGVAVHDILWAVDRHGYRECNRCKPLSKLKVRP